MRLFTKIAIGLVAASAGASMYVAQAGPGGSIDTGFKARAIQLRSDSLTDYRYVLQLQTQARREKDVIKLNCVNDKLVQIKAELNIIDRFQLELQVTSETADPTISMQGLSQASTQVHTLREAAEQCIGQHVLTTESTNEWSHPDIPDNPVVPDWNATFEPPAYASPVN